MNKKLFMTMSRIKANQPLKAFDQILTIDDLKAKVAHAAGTEILDSGLCEQGKVIGPQTTPTVGKVIFPAVDKVGNLWLIYEVDMDLVSKETHEQILNGRAGAFAAFNFDSQHGYGQMSYAIIYEREPEKFPWEANPKTHRVLSDSMLQSVEANSQFFRDSIEKLMNIEL